jgi:RNase P protein component
MCRCDSPYPKNNRLLRQEFAKIRAHPNFQLGVKIARKAIENAAKRFAQKRQ